MSKKQTTKNTRYIDARFIDAKRRGFMQGSAVLTAAAATGATSIAAAATENPVVEPVTKTTEEHAGYQETDRIRQYYLKARF